MTSKAFEWYISNPQKLKKYAGKHVAIVDDKIAGVGKTAKKAYDKAKKKYPKESPLLAYIPTGETLIL